MSALALWAVQFLMGREQPLGLPLQDVLGVGVNVLGSGPDGL